MPEHDVFKINIYNHKEIVKKYAQALLGICSGLIADNDLNEKELYFLRHWLEEHCEYLNDWPFNLLMRKIYTILEDGVITQEELDHFKQVLSDLVGGSLEEVGTTSVNSTTLPLNHDALIIIPNHSFCFTGQFIHGTRKACHASIERLGGIASDGINSKLNYLVIGSVGSHAWVNTSYGRKIEKAVELQEKGQALYIISEEQWVESLN